MRGGTEQEPVGALIAVDVKSSRKIKVDIKTKRAVGLALQEIICQWKLHHLGHACTIYADGCGSMVHAKRMAMQFGLDFIPIPVDEQSLNPAETAIKQLFDAARTTIVDSNGAIPVKYYREVVGGIIVHQNHKFAGSEGYLGRFFGPF